MPKEQSPGKPTTRRYSPEEKAAAVRMVRALRAELGTEQGTVQRVARQLGYGVESVRIVGAPGRHRRRLSSRGVDRGVGADQGTRAGEPRTQACQRDSEASGQFLRGGARPPTQEIVDFIDANRDEFGVEPICTVLRSAGVSVAPSTYYAAKARGPSARACRDAVLGPALVAALWKDNYRVYGARKLWKAARRAGHDVGRDQVARLMRAAGIEGVRRGKRVRTTKPDPGAGAASRSGQAQLHRRRPQPVVGHRPDLRADLGRCGLRLLHHRRVQSDDRRLAGRAAHADHDGARRDRDGPLVTRKYVAGLDMSLRCRIAIHVHSLR